MSVNLSSVRLDHPDLVAEVAAALADAELDAGHVTLELTKSLLIDDTQATHSPNLLDAQQLAALLRDHGPGSHLGANRRSRGQGVRA